MAGTRLAAAIAATAILSACATAPTRATAEAPPANASGAAITEAEVLAAQQAWGAALVRIATDHDAGGLDKARATAATVIDTAYGYNLGPVLFKPTLTQAPRTFRTTRAGALAYFVGGDPAFPEDTGFALKGWRSHETRNAAIFLRGDVAISMGKVLLTDKTGAVTEVDKTWGWRRGPDGTLRIILHHSSLPYRAP
jgi:hypothetical protein